MEIVLVLIILAFTIFLFITEKLPIELAALSALAALMLFGLLNPQEAVSGLSNPATVTVGAMFILSAGLTKTDALRWPTRFLSRLAHNELGLLAALIAMIGGISAFVNNTPIVAVFLPIVLALAGRRSISASKLLIPVSFAAQFGGVCTLIGTSSNLLVSAISQQAGYGPFSMFELGQLGIILLGVGMVYLILIGRRLLPTRRTAQLTDAYQLGEYITELRVMEKSPLTGRSVTEARFGQEHDVTVLEILRDRQKIFSPWYEPICEGDILLVRGKVQDLIELKEAQKLKIEPEFKLRDETLASGDLTLVEVVLPTRSQVVGQTLKELDFRRRYHAIVLALQRRGHTLREKIKTLRLAGGDALLILLPKGEIPQLRADDNFIVLEAVDEPSLRRGRMPIAIIIFALVVGLAAFNVMPIMVSAILGAVAMLLTGCVRIEEAYHAIDWRVIFLLVGLFPLGTAIEKSGAAGFIAQYALASVGKLGAHAALAMTYLITASLTEFISHSAAAVLVSPIAILMASQLGVHPKPFLIAVTFATSTSFSTPVGYQTNTMVYNAGGYRFSDFMKVGIPLNILFFIISALLIPIFWPL